MNKLEINTKYSLNHVVEVKGGALGRIVEIEVKLMTYKKSVQIKYYIATVGWMTEEEIITQYVALLSNK